MVWCNAVDTFYRVSLHALQWPVFWVLAWSIIQSDFIKKTASVIVITVRTTKEC